jgi:hypothetical protein
MKKHTHKWRYSGGDAKCTVPGCKKYLQPDGRVTNTATGKTRKKPKKR